MNKIKLKLYSQGGVHCCSDCTFSTEKAARNWNDELDMVSESAGIWRMHRTRTLFLFACLFCIVWQSWWVMEHVREGFREAFLKKQWSWIPNNIKWWADDSEFLRTVGLVTGMTKLRHTPSFRVNFISLNMESAPPLNNRA